MSQACVAGADAFHRVAQMRAARDQRHEFRRVRRDARGAAARAGYIWSADADARVPRDANGQLQTDARADPFPNGASGWMSIFVDVTDA